MTIRAFVLGVILLAVVGWCMVQESYKQTHARYRLAELARKEDDMRKNLKKLQAEEEGLRSPSRLASLIREKKMNLVVLRTSLPADPVRNMGRLAEQRLPGDVLDEEFARVERQVRVAAVGPR